MKSYDVIARLLHKYRAMSLDVERCRTWRRTTSHDIARHRTIIFRYATWTRIAASFWTWPKIAKTSWDWPPMTATSYNDVVQRRTIYLRWSAITIKSPIVADRKTSITEIYPSQVVVWRRKVPCDRGLSQLPMWIVANKDHIWFKDARWMILSNVCTDLNLTSKSYESFTIRVSPFVEHDEPDIHVATCTTLSRKSSWLSVFRAHLFIWYRSDPLVSKLNCACCRIDVWHTCTWIARFSKHTSWHGHRLFHSELSIFCF